ncbi:predicted protein [Botrytis cinerea T4]|uniref:Uncharacterized protein n=1 Tax=Botryotinia fuckeliana (strain T4) TaxID=999810 RepID=G2YJS2_BOTF4|nr:predicted protein [Botrytis cinerea T4]
MPSCRHAVMPYVHMSSIPNGPFADREFKMQMIEVIAINIL